MLASRGEESGEVQVHAVGLLNSSSSTFEVRDDLAITAAVVVLPYYLPVLTCTGI